MILEESTQPTGIAATLDDLFRRAGVRHPDALALTDPPNRDNFADGAPRTLSFAQADRAISTFAARLRGLGLQTDNVVALHLPNTVESIVAFLGVLRAGMIAAPMPLLWRQREMVSALGQVGAKAIVTCSRVGTSDHAKIAMQSAVELFSIRHVCSFGHDLPDGIVPLDNIFVSDAFDAVAAPPRAGVPAAHVAAVTFDLDASGFVPVWRSHAELVAGGLEIFLEAGGATDAPSLSTIPITSFAGIALTLMPWLLSGGPCHLHHGFDRDALAAQSNRVPDCTIVLPATTAPAVSDAGLLGPKQTVVALWRAPERFPVAKTWTAASPLVDVANFGEIGFVAGRRDESGLPAPIPLGAVNSSRRGDGVPPAIETAHTSTGTLALRGGMVPGRPGISEGQPPHSGLAGVGYVDTGFACRPGRDGQTLIITAPPPGTISVGGYCFRQNQIDALVAQLDPAATLVALPDGDLGHRLAGNAPNRKALQAAVDGPVFNPLILRAFQQRGAPEAA
jgi:AMP-binding enzyme